MTRTKKPRWQRQVFTHKFLGVGERLRLQALEYFSRKCSFIELKIRGSRIIHVLQTAQLHGSVVYESYSEEGIIEPSLTISVQDSDTRPQNDQVEVITLLYDAHTLGMILNQMYDAEFEFIADTLAKIDISTSPAGLADDRFEIDTILRTFNGAVGYEEINKIIATYGHCPEESGLFSSIESKTFECRIRARWIESFESFLLGIEQLVSRNRVNAAIKFVVSSTQALVQLASRHPCFDTNMPNKLNELAISEYATIEETKQKAKLFRLVWQLHRCACLAWVDVCERFPFYTISHSFGHNFGRPCEVPEIECGNSDLWYDTGASNINNRLLRDHWRRFGLSSVDEANFHYTTGSMNFARLELRAKDPNGRSSSENDFRFALQELSSATIMDPEKELYKAELQACLDMRKRQLKVPLKENSYLPHMPSVPYTDIDGNAQVYIGERFLKYHDSLRIMPRAEKLVYGTDLDRFDRILDRLMDRRLQTLRSR